MRPVLKKTLKVAAALSGVAVVGVAAAAWYVSRPEWQRTQALAALHAAGWTGDIRSLRVGLDGAIALEGVDLAAPDGSLKIALTSAVGAVNLWDTVSGTPHIQSLTLEGLKLTPGTSAEAGKPAATSSPSAPKPLPRVLVDSASVAGEFAPHDGEPVAFSLRVRDVDTLAGGRAVASVSRGPLAVTAEGVIRFAGVPMIGGSTLDFLRSAAPAPDIEAELRLGSGLAPVKMTLRGDASAMTLKAKEGASVVELRGESPYADARRLALTWRADAASLAALLPAGAPKFESQGTAAWTADSGLSVTADYSGDPVFPGGPGHAAVSGAVSMSGDRRFRVERARVSIGDAAASPQVVAESLTPFDFELTESDAPRFDKVSGELVRVTLAGVPVRWFERLTAALPVRPVAGRIDGQFRLDAPEGGGWRLHMPRPVTVSELTLKRTTGRAISGLRVTAAGELTSAGDGAVALRDAAVVVFNGAAEAAAVRRGVFTLSPSGDYAASADFGLNPAVWPELVATASASEYFREAQLRLAGALAVSGSRKSGATVTAASVSALTASGAAPVVARLEQPLSLKTVATDKSASALVTLKEAPLTLVNPFLDGDPLAGVAHDARIRVSLTGAGVAVESDGPVRLSGLVWKPLGTAEASPAPVSVTGAFSWVPSKTGWRLKLAGLDATNALGRGVHGDFDWRHEDHAPDSIIADLKGGLPALFASVPAYSPGVLTAGDYAVNAFVRFDGESTWSLRLDGITPEPGAVPRTFTVSGSTRPEGAAFHGKTTAILKGPSGSTAFDADVRYFPEQSGKVEVLLTGDTLYADDWLAFVRRDEAAGKPSAPEGKPASSGAPFAAIAPLHATVSLNTLIGSGECVTGLRGVIDATPNRVTLSDVAARWRTLDIGGKASLEGPAPWRYSVDVGIPAADSEAFLRTWSEEAASRLSGKLAVSLKADSEAPSSDGLLWATRGAVSVTGKSGRLRYAGKPGEVKQKAASVFDIPGDVAGALGGVIGDRDNAVARVFHSMNLVRTALGEIQYDNFEFTANRAATGVWDPVKLDVSNSVLRLAAAGRVAAPVHGVPWSNRACSLEVRVGGKLGLANTMRDWVGRDKAEEKDGYVLGPVIRLDGSLGNIDANLMKSLSETVPGGNAVSNGLKRFIP